MNLYLTPVSEPPNVAPLLDANCHERGGQQAPHILLVDDDRQTLTLISRILSRRGYHVTTAASAEEAFRAHEENRCIFDLVIMDLVMPHIDGYQAYHHIHALQPELPVLFVSGSMPAIPGREIVARSLPFLAKPFRPDELIAWVSSLV